MPDGRNYMVDVTQCESGWPTFFMLPTGGGWNQGYDFEVDYLTTLLYFYDFDLKQEMRSASYVLSNVNYVDANRLTPGWHQAGTTWVYAGDGGWPRKSAWVSSGGAWYWMDANGHMATGWRPVRGFWYYFDKSGAMATGWKYLDYDWYYFHGSGAMATGWQYINGNWYYFYGSGRMARSTYVGGYWLSSSGAMRR